MFNQPFDRYASRLEQLAEKAKTLEKDMYEPYLTTRTVDKTRDFLIACRHWNSTTPIIPRRFSELLPYPRMAGYGFGGGYFLVLNGVGIVVDPGYGFMQLLYSSYGYTICDIDVVFVTHDHPDHWADLANILILKYAASKHRGTPSREPRVYLSRSLTQLHDFLFSPDRPCSTIGQGQIVTISGADGQPAARATGVRAFHSERLSSDVNSPNAIGLHFEAEPVPLEKPRMRRIAIAGDTQFPSPGKRRKGLREFTDQDEQEFAREYDAGRPGVEGSPRGDRQIDVLAMHIGSIERQMIGILKARDPLEFVENEVFYDGYHLGFAGCLKMLNMVFANQQANKLALLTEFGEELRGYRVDLASALENATRANLPDRRNVRVLPADIGMALQLTWDPHARLQEPLLRCSKCLLMQEFECRQGGKPLDYMAAQFFHPISDMQVFEDLDTGLVQYCCCW